jgi:hypothetical protein
MKSSDPFTIALLKAIDTLPHDVFNFTKLNIACISLLTDKAVELFFNVNDKKYESWIPFSQLRKDNNNEIWIANWLLERIKTNSKNERN